MQHLRTSKYSVRIFFPLALPRLLMMKMHFGVKMKDNHHIAGLILADASTNK